MFVCIEEAPKLLVLYEWKIVHSFIQVRFTIVFKPEIESDKGILTQRSSGQPPNKIRVYPDFTCSQLLLKVNSACNESIRFNVTEWHPNRYRFICSQSKLNERFNSMDPFTRDVTRFQADDFSDESAFEVLLIRFFYVYIWFSCSRLDLMSWSRTAWYFYATIYGNCYLS